MKRVIVSSRVEDIRQELETKRREKQESDNRRDQQRSKYSEAISSVSSSIRDYIMNIVRSSGASESYLDDIEVKAEDRYNETWMVTVRYGENKVSDTDLALKWSWSARIGSDGTILKESNSWSGLNAVSAENVSNLEDTLKVVKSLNSVSEDDLESILTKPVPDYSDYVTEPKYHLDENDYASRIAQARVEDSIGKNVGFRISSEPLGPDENGEEMFIRFERETNKMYVVTRVYHSRFRGNDRWTVSDTFKSKKDTVLNQIKDIDNPVDLPDSVR